MNSALKNYVDKTGKKVVKGLVDHVKSKVGVEVDGMAAYFKHKTDDYSPEEWAHRAGLKRDIKQLTDKFSILEMDFKTTEELEVILNEIKCQNSKI